MRAALLCLLLAALPLAAEQRFSASTDIVAVEVPVQVVRDGKPVRGLAAGDFEVYEGRARQPVTGFEVVDLAAVPAGPGGKAPRLPISSRRKFVLMFDMGFSSPASMARARQSARGLLRGAFHPADLIAVAAYYPAKGPQLLLGFTSDRKLVEEAIDHLDPVQRFNGGFELSDPLLLAGNEAAPPGGSIRRSVLDNAAETAAAGGKDGGGDGGGGLTDHIDPIGQPLERADRTASQRSMEEFTRAIGAFADTLASIRGRKYVVLLSEGFDSTVAMGVSDVGEIIDMDTHSIYGDVWNIDSDKRFGNTQAGVALERMLESLRRADCVVQAVDIGGARAGAEATHMGHQKGADALFVMANSTGGEFYPNFNDLSAAMGKMLDRTSVTYVLTFQPDVRRDGQYHKLRVELKNPQGARLVYRPGYYAPKPYSRQTAMERMLHASGQVAAGQEGGPVGVAVLAAPFQGAAGRAYVPVLIEIDGASLLAASPGDAAPAGGVVPAEIYAYAFDAQGAVRDYFTERLGLDLAKVGPVVRRSGVKLFGHLDLPPGSYSLRVLVRNGLTGAAGLKVASVEVPVFAAATPVLLPPFFPEAPGRWLVVREAKTRQGDAPYPFLSKSRPYIPASKPALAPGRDAAMALIGYHLGAGPLTAQAVVMTAEGKEAGVGKIVLLGREEADGSGPERLTATFRPPRLEPGEYELLLTLVDARGASQTSLTAFVVPGSGGAAKRKAGEAGR
jgi:VWFA-related protein